MDTSSKKIALITGLPGSGKTTIANEFQQKPLDDWHSFDFDKGKFKIPPTENTETQYKQLVWWLHKSESLLAEDGGNCVIFGFWGFPDTLDKAITETGIASEMIMLGYLHADLDTLRSRKIVRGGKKKYRDTLTGWKKAFITDLEEIGAKRFDTSEATADEVYQDIKQWLNGISESS
jgi:adenylate kinase family enzyme